MQVHPAQINPAEAFDVFYFLRNHTDGATYYVRAVIYDVRTGELLTTVNLTQSPTNSRLFITTLQAPPDPVGIGRNIVAIATIYTDSGYTTKSPDYAEQEQYFLIRSVPQITVGGGGVDMNQMKELVENILDDRLKKLPKPQDLPPMPFEAVFSSIGKLQESVNKIPKEAYDESNVLAAIGGVKAAVEAIPEPEPLDLSPVTTKLDAVLSTLTGLPKILSDAARVLVSAQAQSLKNAGDTIVEHAKKGIKEMMGKQELIVPMSAFLKNESPPKEEEEDPAASVAHIM